MTFNTRATHARIVASCRYYSTFDVSRLASGRRNPYVSRRGVAAPKPTESTSRRYHLTKEREREEKERAREFRIPRILSVSLSP